MPRSPTRLLPLLSLLLLATAPPAAAAEDDEGALCLTNDTPPKVDTDDCGPDKPLAVRVILRYMSVSGPREVDIGPCHENCDVTIIIDLIVCRSTHVNDDPERYLDAQANLADDAREEMEAFAASVVQEKYDEVKPLLPERVPGWCMVEKLPTVSW